MSRSVLCKAVCAALSLLFGFLGYTSYIPPAGSGGSQTARQTVYADNIASYKAGNNRDFFEQNSGAATVDPSPLETLQTEYRDLSYGSSAQQTASVFMPSDINTRKGPYNVLLDIHGGFWFSGEKSKSPLRFAKYILEGYVCVSMDYRLLGNNENLYGVGLALNLPQRSNGTHCSDMLDDIDSVLALVRSLLEAGGRTVGKCALYGFSAGAHLATLYAYSRGKSAPIEPAFCISASGPVSLTDFDYFMTLKNTKNMAGLIGLSGFWVPSDYKLYLRLFSDLVGIKLTESSINDPAVREAFAKISPQSYINSAVPTIILCGGRDKLVPAQIFGEALHNALDAAHVPNRYHLMQEKGHSSLWHSGDIDEYMELYFNNPK